MKKKAIYLGNTEVKISKSEVEGHFVEIENEKFYKISNCNEMPDFFMTIVSDSDHWMFISSNGSLSAGRKDRNNALFPYYTVDKIHDYRGITGSKTYVLVSKDDKTYLWEPFSTESEKIYRIERNLYKSIYGNKIIFEEINVDLGVGFRYGWYNSEKFGFVKKSVISNHNEKVSYCLIYSMGLRTFFQMARIMIFRIHSAICLMPIKKVNCSKKPGLGLYHAEFNPCRSCRTE